MLCEILGRGEENNVLTDYCENSRKDGRKIGTKCFELRQMNMVLFRVFWRTIFALLKILFNRIGARFGPLL